MKELTLIRTNQDGTMKYRDARGYVRYLDEWGQPISMTAYYLRPVFVWAAVIVIGTPIMYVIALILNWLQHVAR